MRRTSVRKVSANRGFQQAARGWLIDIWTLRDTWAFRERFIPDVSFNNLVQTTFLDVEAVAAEVFTRRGRQRRIYSAGFFEAIERQVVDISFEPNPFPALCVVRSIITAVRLNFRLSRRLAEYITRHASQIPLETLMKIQESHYGKIRIEPMKMLEYLSHINEQLRFGSIEVVGIPTTRAEQLDLSRYWTPAS